MLKKIELWDFECHKHSVLENFHDGLNLVFGESDSGKTSVIRALKLVAYNEFDPNSVRTGKKNCKVRVETDKGWVEVERGTKNIWTTCLPGGSPEVFEKIGKNILPQAASILGLHMAKLGDMTLPVNVMDQGEGHFMLNELGGDSASGSMRAQIVDEISGLSGIESLIKDVSLDRHRFGRQVKELEDKAKALRETMHDKKELEDEKALLEEVGELLSEKRLKEGKTEALAEIYMERHELSEETGKLTSKLAAMPNTKIVKAVIAKAEKFAGESSKAAPLIKEYRTLSLDIERIEESLSRIPNLDKARREVERSEELVRESRSREMESLVSEHSQCVGEVSILENRLAGIPDLDSARKAVNDCDALIKRSSEANVRAFELSDCLEEMDEAQERLDECEVELRAAVKERNEAMSEVTVCPLTGGSVSGECLKGMKFPVIKGDD